MNRSRWLIPVVLTAPLFALLMSMVALADSAHVTDTFTASATSGNGQSQPIVVDPTTLTLRSDGAVGLGYTYTAAGTADGDIPGTVSYEEHGWLYFANPADPTSYAGSSFTSGVFTLTSRKAKPGDAPIQIADRDPAGY